jgi:hypothetical protein
MDSTKYRIFSRSDEAFMRKNLDMTHLTSILTGWMDQPSHRIAQRSPRSIEAAFGEQGRR